MTIVLKYFYSLLLFAIVTFHELMFFYCDIFVSVLSTTKFMPIELVNIIVHDTNIKDLIFFYQNKA